MFFRTAYSVFLPQVVAREHLEPANGRLFGTESAMQIAGPGVGGLLAQWFSAAFGILLDAVSFLVSAACLWRIRPRNEAPVITAPTATLRTRIGEGVAFVRRDRYLLWFTAIGGLANLGHTGMGALLVLFLVRDLDLDPSGVGLVMAVGSSGGLVGAVFATRLSRRIGSGYASTLFLLGAGLAVPPGPDRDPGVRRRPGRAGTVPRRDVRGRRQRRPRRLAAALRPRAADGTGDHHDPAGQLRDHARRRCPGRLARHAPSACGRRSR